MLRVPAVASRAAAYVVHARPGYAHHGGIRSMRHSMRHSMPWRVVVSLEARGHEASPGAPGANECWRPYTTSTPVVRRTSGGASAGGLHPSSQLVCGPGSWTTCGSGVMQQRRGAHFSSSRIVDFRVTLDEAAESLNTHMKSTYAGPLKVWRKNKSQHTARAAYLPYYVFDVEADVFFKGKLPGTKGYTDEFVFRRVRFHADGSGDNAVDMMVYGSYDYRREYAHAVKHVALELAEPLKFALASPSLGRLAESHPPVHPDGRHERPDLDPFEMSQTFAYDMVQERMLKHAKMLAQEYFSKHMGQHAVVDTRVALKVRRRQCTPVFLPVYVFQYSYLGLNYRALVSGNGQGVGGEVHRSPLFVTGSLLSLHMFAAPRLLAAMLPLYVVAIGAVTLQPAVMKLLRGFKRRWESSKDAGASSRKDWYEWERSGHWGQWFQAKWQAREQQHRRKEEERETFNHTTTVTAEEGEQSLYAILGLQGQERSATTEDIKRAFRRLALKYHPDAVRSKPTFEQKQATERFRRILDAYKVLRNPKQRAKYDVGQSW